MVKCYRCPKEVVDGEHRLYSGETPVSLCKPCYDIEIAKNNKRDWEAFRHRNKRKPTRADEERDLNSDYLDSVRPSKYI